MNLPLFLCESTAPKFHQKCRGWSRCGLDRRWMRAHRSVSCLRCRVFRMRYAGANFSIRGFFSVDIWSRPLLYERTAGARESDGVRSRFMSASTSSSFQAFPGNWEHPAVGGVLDTRENGANADARIVAFSTTVRFVLFSTVG